MENQTPSVGSHDLRMVMDNITNKMNQIKHMFPNYHESLDARFKEMKMAQAKS